MDTKILSRQFHKEIHYNHIRRTTYADAIYFDPSFEAFLGNASSEELGNLVFKPGDNLLSFRNLKKSKVWCIFSSLKYFPKYGQNFSFFSNTKKYCLIEMLNEKKHYICTDI